MTLLFLGLAAHPGLPACTAPTGDRLYTLAISVAGHTLGGLGAVAFGPDSFQLVALSPTGPELFTVARSGDQTTLTAAFPAWEPWLARLPFERDLRLVAPDRAQTCRDGTATVRVDGPVRRWRGRGGPARAELGEDGRWTVTDPRRGYTLTLAEAR